MLFTVSVWFVPVTLQGNSPGNAFKVSLFKQGQHMKQDREHSNQYQASVRDISVTDLSWLVYTVLSRFTCEG